MIRTSLFFLFVLATFGCAAPQTGRVAHDASSACDALAGDAFVAPSKEGGVADLRELTTPRSEFARPLSTSSGRGAAGDLDMGTGTRSAALGRRSARERDVAVCSR